MNRFATHIPVLLACLRRTTGPILELGSGKFSTPLINAFAGERLARTVETQGEWLSRIIAFCEPPADTHRHEFVQVESYAHAVLDDHPWSVVLIDHGPAEQRVPDICRLRSRCQLMVVHDTECPVYGYEPAFNQFRYRFDFRQLEPWTSVLSDTDPLDWLPAVLPAD